jgi:superfamily II DNA/RNA helicase
MTDFLNFGLPPALTDTLTRMGYLIPTPVQAQTLPPALEGKDILGSAQTGTGKTAAFGIPLMVRLMNNPRGSALILAPTRELATQIMTMLKQMLGPYNTIQTALLIGGESMGPQFQQLRNRPRLIVGTPGRINDHLERGTLMLHDTGFLVLDETDRMLDLGFSAQIERIAKFLPKVRQTLLFSATLPDNILKLSERYLTNPVRIKIGETTTPAINIDHTIIHTDGNNKYELLLKELHSREGSIIVFVKTKRGAERLAERLEKQRLSADAIHGDLKQSQRDRVISAFRDKKHRIMVATDIAARGLDIPHIEHVINYDLPQAPEDYIHRIGRTARAGALGSAMSLISPEDAGKWREIQQLMNPQAAQQARQDGHRHNGGHGNGGGNSSKRRRHFRDRRPSGHSPSRERPAN